MEEIRLNKFISNNSKFSRRDIDEFIQEGRVTVNGITIEEPGERVDPTKDEVRLDGEEVKPTSKWVYIVFYKPAKTITSVDDDMGRTTVMDYVNTKYNLFPVGRLDFDTTGVLLLTNDGDFANKMMHPNFKISKTYDVKLSKPLEEKHRLALMKGVVIAGKKTLPCVIKYKHNKNHAVVTITLKEGRNRQVKKMFEKFGYFVQKLHRAKYGNISVGNLKIGTWRYLTAKELKELNSLINEEYKSMKSGIMTSEDSKIINKKEENAE